MQPAMMVGLAEWSVRRTVRQVLRAANSAGLGMPSTPPTNQSRPTIAAAPFESGQTPE